MGGNVDRTGQDWYRIGLGGMDAARTGRKGKARQGKGNRSTKMAGNLHRLERKGGVGRPAERVHQQEGSRTGTSGLVAT